MPAYDFKCRKCQKVFEERHSIFAIPRVVKCECGGTAKRMLSPGGVGYVTPDWKPYASIRLPLNLKGVKCDSAGRPLITDRRVEERVLKDHGYVRE